jgi:superfamily II DNA or RNA helicase
MSANLFAVSNEYAPLPEVPPVITTPHLELVPPVEPDEPDDVKPSSLAGGFQLRAHQARAVNAVRDAFKRENPERVRRTLVVHPTASGKTFVMAELARRAMDAGNDVLWVIPAGPPVDNLAEDGMEAMQRIGRVALVEKAEKDALPQYIHNFEEKRGQTIICSAPSLRGERLARWVPVLRNPLILIDEAHFGPTQTIFNILDCWPRSFVVGFTATPDRADGKSLGCIFQSLADEYKLVDAIQEGRLVKPLACPIITDPPIDLKNIKITADGDFDDDELEQLIIDNMERLVSEAKPALLGRKTLAFTPNIQSAFALSEAFKQVGLKSTYIASKDVDGRPMSKEKRRDIIKAFEAGHYDILCNPILLSTGFNCPMVDCIANFRPTKSRSRYAQIVGRAMRLYGDKDHCLIVDFACDGHDLVSIVDLYDDTTRDKEVVARAKEIMKEGKQADPQKALELAEEEHSIRLEKMLQLRERQATAARRVYDPLAAMSLLGVAPSHKEGQWFQSRPADERDKAYLNKVFNKTRQNVDVEQMSYYTAKNLKKKALERQKKGLCTINQIALLISRGLPPHEAQGVKFSEVNAVLQQLQGAR